MATASVNRPEEPPVESITLELEPQEAQALLNFLTSDAQGFSTIRLDHPDVYPVIYALAETGVLIVPDGWGQE